MELSSIETDCSVPYFPISRMNSSENNFSYKKTPLKSGEKQISFEVKSSTINRKIEVKTKQEDTICRTNKYSPTITCSTTTSPITSPKNIRIHRSPKSSISNSSIQSVRVSVSPSANPNEKSPSESKNYSSILSNFIEENLNDKEERFDRRPLLDLINQLNEKNQSEKQIPSPTILPAKQFSPFKPVILHKKYQEPIGRFDLINNSRDGIQRSQTFSNCEDVLPKSASSLSLAISPLTNTTPTSNTNIDDKNEAKRKAIAMQMYDTEKSYVEALKNLVTKYYLPMKDKDIVSNDLINDIFYKIPEIHIHHTAFLISLSQKLSQWNNKQTVGDLLLQMFSRTSVIETYTSFVNNYKTAQIAIGLCRDNSSFNKFLEQQARDHRGKLTLRDLIIQPVQRIPRYELFIKDFLKCTNLNHPDYQLLLKSQSEIHSLAEQIDQVQKEVGSTDLNINQNSLEIFQEIIQNLDNFVDLNRYYIRHDLVTLQSSSGVKKDRCIFLFNDLILITSCKRKTGNLNKKNTNSILINSPSGKQYIENDKHKLIMKISLDSVDLAIDHFKKRRESTITPPVLNKSSSIINNFASEKNRNLEEDLLTLGQISHLAKTISISHQQLDESIKETINNVNKHFVNEPPPTIETNSITDQKSNSIQLIINTSERIETIDVLFSSLENKISWEKTFLEAKKILLENSNGRKNPTFDHVLTLPQNRAGSEFTCGTIRCYSNDLCLCNTEGDICLINIQSDIKLKSFNSITLAKINTITYIPAFNKQNSSILNKQNVKEIKKLEKQQEINLDSLLDIDSSDEEDFDNTSFNHLQFNSTNKQFNYQEEDTIWLGTQNGELFIYQCSQTMNIVGRKNRIVKQFNCSIHSILYNDNQVYIALNHGQLCVFRRDTNGHWDLGNPIIQLIELNSNESSGKTTQIDNGENVHPISVMSFVKGKLWCGISDRIFIVCPNSLNVQHSFIVDDYHRHISCIATENSSMNHVWISSQDSHEIRLYHSINYVCLLEISIRPIITQKLQVCDDIIRAHKLGCLHVTTLHIYKDILWIGTSAGIIINLFMSQINDSLIVNKLTQNSIQLECLSYGHEGPVKFIISKKSEQIDHLNTFIISIGDGFENFDQNQENLGKDDALYHLIFWKLQF